MSGPLPLSELVLWITKLIHIATISLWAGGLVALPFLLAQRNGLMGDALHRLHRLVRFLHIEIVSPAAFAAVVSGILLIFLREVFFVWFTAKLYLVAALVVCHVLVGLAISSTFAPDGAFRPLPAVLLTGGITVAAGGVLFFVLAKPIISLEAIVGERAEAGWLEDTFVGPLVDMLISLTR